MRRRVKRCFSAQVSTSHHGACTLSHSYLALTIMCYLHFVTSPPVPVPPLLLVLQALKKCLAKKGLYPV